MPRAKQVVGDYMDYATIHGVGRTKNSPFLILKLFWVLALCGSFGMIIWQVYELYLKYKSAPISTSIEIKYADKLEFPMITICNTNPAQYSKIGHSRLDAIIKSASDKYDLDLDLFDYEEDATRAPIEPSPRENTTVDSDILSATASKFKMLLSITDDMELDNISQPLEQFFLMCNFMGKECPQDLIYPVRTFEYGLCYQIDPWFDDRIKHGMTSGYGPDYALELLLYVNKEETLPFVTSSSGIAVLPQSRDGNFFDAASSIYVPTGFEANIGLKHTVFDSVPGQNPPKRCNVDEHEQSLLDCRENCKQEYILGSCACYQYFFMYGTLNSSTSLNETFSDEGYSPCYTEEHYRCIESVKSYFIQQNPEDCQLCVPLCKRTEYKKELSMFTWPNEMFSPILKHILASRLRDAPDMNRMTKEYMQENFALVRVYLSSLTYDYIKEEYAYSFENFLSDIGGQLGLWAGFSVLSILELVELVVILIATRKKAADHTNTVTDISITNEKTASFE